MVTNDRVPSVGTKARQAKPIIGVDFDNTIIRYDELMYAVASDWKLIKPGPSVKKPEIRRIVRALPNGEHLWRQLQAAVYGQEIESAPPFDGVKNFFLACRKHTIPIHIVSHKTIHPDQGFQDVNLRECALAWLTRQEFFAPAPIGLTQSQVHFESTRRQKLNRIRQLRCTHFIDDLIEVFRDKYFPAQVKKILLSTTNTRADVANLEVFPAWKNIHYEFFSEFK